MSEFSLEGYHELLSSLKNAGYSFCWFEEIDFRLTEGRPFVVLRHDIDISLRFALEIARAEYKQDVQSTYFVTLHSPFYNALSCDSTNIIQQICQMGHQIALHVDPMAYDGDCAQALMEIDVFSKFYPYANTHLASLHSPINLESMPIESFEQLQHVYGHMLGKKMAYISDSTGRWRYGHPLDSEAFYQRKPFQLLTHPIWWMQDGETPTEKLKRCLYKEYSHIPTAAKEFLPKLFRSSES